MPSIFQGPLEEGHHGRRYVKATPAALVAKGQEVVWMLLAAGASAAVRPDARLVHQREGALEGRPVALELFPKPALYRRVEMILLLHKGNIANNVCIS